ncbi:MAG: GNAT family N-acetyltransferase [Zhongshania sp.]|uniref:GNAT family N-acetyltransferase n=1 Tax=Zhongshania sp. TaxID=1971902 RepID=UPI002626D421|nr:GNAT family N-acetyltransferase [Zhongshania sp.]MDF1693476.1 GNAT family N-acetyltransferase [Zhongshania sp.]
MKTITIVKAAWTEYQQQLTAIRHTVFVNEQKVPEALELDEFDATATHWLAFHNKEAIATVRLLDNGTIGRMAVLSPYRRKGVGKALLQHCIIEAKDRGMASLQLGAQVHAIEFYQHQGFELLGPRFMDAGIPHQHMRMVLKPVLRSGFTTEINLQGNPARAAVDLLKNTRWELRIFSHSLESALYANEHFLRYAHEFIHRHQGNTIFLMICDEMPLREHHHPLLDMSREWKTAIPIRKLSIGHTFGAKEFFMVGDEDKLITYPHQSALNKAEYCDVESIARDYRENFDRLWRHAEPPLSLKPFY